MNMIKFLSLIFITCFLSDFHQLGTNSLQGTESPPAEESVIGETMTSKEDIISAFRFWVNKHAWIYGDSCYYTDSPKTIEVYYEVQEQSYEEQDYYAGHVFVPFQKKGKTYYRYVTFSFNKEGLQSEPVNERQTDSIEDGLIYLGKETFYYTKNDVSKPEYPASSPQKIEFIKKAKEAITESISSGHYEKGEYRIYIRNFTNEAVVANVLIIKDNDEMWNSSVCSQIQSDDGSLLTEKAFFRGIHTAPGYWSDDHLRKFAEKKIQLSVCDFTVIAP